ncbi:hypothetical protein EV194_10714 [Natronoflexus pectinivorans]|uniref:Uncharacterized protein n=1 Tax=Natronoflexus pectinivorans TaxID=682526 RepID=A0A4R2GJQ1_9BACT|nr:hypothetical protein EV194_10714 [Natronoflexus pectinivorans]
MAVCLQIYKQRTCFRKATAFKQKLCLGNVYNLFKFYLSVFYFYVSRACFVGCVLCNCQWVRFVLL